MTAAFKSGLAPHAFKADRPITPARRQFGSRVNRAVPAPEYPMPAPEIAQARLDCVSTIYRSRRQRAGMFGGVPGIFAEPAWDILLDLYIGWLRDDLRSVSSACIASAVSISTGLRYLRRLQRAGLVECGGDRDDRRRSFVWLTPRALAAFEAWFTNHDFGEASRNIASSTAVDTPLHASPTSDESMAMCDIKPQVQA